MCSGYKVVVCAKGVMTGCPSVTTSCSLSSGVIVNSCPSVSIKPGYVDVTDESGYEVVTEANFDSINSQYKEINITPYLL